MGITIAFLRGVLISQQQQQLRGGMAMNAHIVKQILKEEFSVCLRS